MTRFSRRATTIFAALLAAPLALAIAVGAGPQAALAAAPAAAHAVQAAGSAVDAADVLEQATKKKKKKKKKKTAKKPAAVVTPAPAQPVESGYDAVENQVVALTNNQRAANGCGPLRIDSRLVAAARAHSTDMVTHDFFDHTGSNGSTFVQREAAAGYTTGASAENIAWGYRTAEEVVTGWMNSAGHRANILNCESVAVGVGVAYKADGTPYWTQDFGRV